LPSQLTRYDFPDGNLKVVNELLNLG